MMKQHTETMAQSHIQEQINLIARHEQEFLSQRTRSERLGDRIANFAGSFWFVSFHLTAWLLWILFNSLPLTRAYHLDPYPFPFLGTLITMEAILLASFILMRQARMGKRADERDHLMLQILLLTERELTAVLKMDREIAREVGLEAVAEGREVRELSRHTSIEEVAQQIRENLPSSDES